MKRKYYMRGLGIGVIITAIIFTVAAPKKEVTMTDEEVIARAQKLGYVKDEGGVTPEDINKIKDSDKTTGTPAVSEDTTNVTEEPESTQGPTLSPEPTPAPPDEPDKPDEPTVPATPTPGVKATATPKPAATSTPKPTATTAVKPTATQKPVATPTKSPSVTSQTIRVERGMTATKVAGLLVEIGAVSDPADFVAYLRKNNLTDFINIGTFTIPQGAGYEEIARILTK